LINVDVLASTGAFIATVCLIAVRRSVSGWTGCRRSGRLGKTSQWTETRGLTNSPTSVTSCSLRNWAANGD